MKNLAMLMSGGFLLALTACGDADIAGDCQPELGDDLDCQIDSVCEEECLLDNSCGPDVIIDPEDPDCDPCLFDQSCDECLYPDPPERCECEGPNPPPRCDPFVPDTASMNATVAYDSNTDTGRSFFITGQMGDVEVAPEFSIFIADARLDSTSNPAYACSLGVTATDALTAQAANRSIELQKSTSSSDRETVDFVGYEVVFEPGKFSVADAPYDTQSGTVAGCGEKYVDPATWGDSATGLSDAVAAGTWAFSWTNMAPIIDEILSRADNNDPMSDYDIYDLNQNGYIAGGNMAKPAASTDAKTGYYYAYGFALDSENWKTVPSGNEDDPDTRLEVGDMIPTEGKPANGAYFIRSYNQWGAEYILLDKTPS